MLRRIFAKKITMLRTATTKLVLLITILSSFSIGSNAQIINLLPNPDNGNAVWRKFFIYNDNLFFSYTNASGHEVLARYNDTGIVLIKSPDTTTRNFLHFSVLNNTLYIGCDGMTFGSLMKYEGDSLKYIPFPPSILSANISSVSGEKFFHNDSSNLYFACTNSAVQIQIAKFNGTSIDTVPGTQTNSYRPPFTFNGNLFFVNDVGNLARYDGNNVTVIPNYDNGYGVIANFFVHNNDLYFTYVGEDQNYLGKYDAADTLVLVPNPTSTSGSGVTHHHFQAINGALFCRYNINSKLQLAKYNNGVLQLIYNPDTFGSIPHVNTEMFLHEYGSEYYTNYSASPQNSYIAKVEDTSIALVSNPTATGGPFSFQFFEYNNSMYYSYITPNVNTYIAKYDGSSAILLPKLSSGDQVVLDYENLIKFNDKIFFPYYNSPTNRYQIGYIDATLSIDQHPRSSIGNVTIYPNPLPDNNLTIQTQGFKNGNYVLDIIDILGKTVCTKHLLIDSKTDIHKLSLDFLPTGSYILNITGNNGIISTKLVRL